LFRGAEASEQIGQLLLNGLTSFMAYTGQKVRDSGNPVEHRLQEEIRRNSLRSDAAFTTGQPASKSLRDSNTLERAKIRSVIAREPEVETQKRPLQR
jgi:hypothetical protein